MVYVIKLRIASGYILQSLNRHAQLFYDSRIAFMQVGITSVTKWSFPILSVSENNTSAWAITHISPVTIMYTAQNATHFSVNTTPLMVAFKTTCAV